MSKLNSKSIEFETIFGEYIKANKPKDKTVGEIKFETNKKSKR